MKKEILRRSTLYVPVTVSKFVEKAYQRGADAILLDLEDSIPLNKKVEARRLIKGRLPKIKKGGADALVRINSEWKIAKLDLNASIWPGLDCIAIPKVESAKDVIRIDNFISSLEEKRSINVGKIQLEILIETPIGLLNAYEILKSSPRIVSVNLGIEDFTKELGIKSTVKGDEVFTANSMLIIIANAAGIQPIGLLGSMADYSHLDVFEKNVIRSRNIGFKGAECIHPTQVQILNKYFSPSQNEIKKAKKIVAAFENAKDEGKASIAIEGKMIDIPVYERSLDLLKHTLRIVEKESTLQQYLQESKEE